MDKIPLTPKNPNNKHLKAYSKAVEEGGKINKSMEKEKCDNCDEEIIQISNRSRNT